MDTRLQKRVLGLGDEPREFISRLKIIDEKGQDRYFDNPFNEQVCALNDFLSPAETIVHYKPRQIGDTTIAAAYNFSYLYWTPDPVRALVVAHDYEATTSIFEKIRHYHESLPSLLRRETYRSSRKELIFSDTQAGFRCLTAGGRSEGRAWTYQRLHADELAYWPHAEDVWASITSTLHPGPHRKIVILSTANGPGNLFHQKVMSALESQRNGDPSVAFRFFKWSDHAAYQTEPPEGWEPEQEEWDLSQSHGLTMPQLYWRHERIYGVNGIGLHRFRREYPLTIEDGFSIFDGAWFDTDYLNEVLSSLGASEGELRIHERPMPGLTYAMGVDPSWCNGGDHAVAQVMSHDGRLVATLSTNQGGELLFFEKAVELARYFNKAKTLVESNPGGAGIVGLREFRKGGIPLWVQPAKPGQMPSKSPNYWTTSRGSKEQGYAHLRQMVNGDALTLNDMATVQELMHIREVNGKIEGQDGYHDDHSDALMLAEWNRRTLPKAEAPMRRSKRRYKARRNPFLTSTGL